MAGVVERLDQFQRGDGIDPFVNGGGIIDRDREEDGRDTEPAKPWLLSALSTIPTSDHTRDNRGDERLKGSKAGRYRGAHRLMGFGL